MAAAAVALRVVCGRSTPFEVTPHQELVLPELRARAFAVLLADEMGAVPLAMLLYGFLMVRPACGRR